MKHNNIKHIHNTSTSVYIDRGIYIRWMWMPSYYIYLSSQFNNLTKQKKKSCAAL